MSSSRSPDTSTLPLARAVRERLHTGWLGRPLEGHVRLGSTNEHALQRAREGAPEGTTVLADAQTNGRGRHGRDWHAQAGQNLTFSVVLRPAEPLSLGRPALPSACWGLLALAGGLAACEAVAEVTGAFGVPVAPRLKWPNDVLIDGHKCCGVLLETASAGSHAPGPVVLGVGLNVNQRDFPAVAAASGRPRPTSLALATGRPHLPRAPLLAHLLHRLDAHYQSLFADGGQALRSACEARMAGLGARVTVRRLASPRAGDEAPLEGVFRGLAPSGALRLETDDGRERRLHAGDVTLRPVADDEAPVEPS